MKNIIILLVILSIIGCSSTAKIKMKEQLNEVAHAVEILNDKICAEKNEELRAIIRTGIRFYFPGYPDEGYCNLVEMLDGK